MYLLHVAYSPTLEIYYRAAYLVGRTIQIGLDRNTETSHPLHRLLSWDGLAGRAGRGAVLRIFEADLNGADGFGGSAGAGREPWRREGAQRQSHGLSEEGSSGTGATSAVIGFIAIGGGTHFEST